MSEPTEDMDREQALRIATRMAIVWGVLFCVGGLCTCITAALFKVKWVELAAQDKFILILLILGNFIGHITAYLSKAIARLESGKGLPINGGSDTSFLTTTDITRTTEKTTHEKK